METEHPFACRALQPADALGFRLCTFPAMEPLLRSAGTSEHTVAIGLETADGIAAGLALARLESGGTAEVASFFVRPPWRGRGLGHLLHDAFTQACLARGVAHIQATYMSAQASTAALEALLARHGWSAPVPSMLVVHASLDSIRHAPWIKPYPLPAGMEIVRWLGVTPQERDDLVAWDAREPWIAPDLRPFDHEADCEPHTSLALKRQGRVVGWVINHRVSDVLRYTCSFLHPRLQRMGRILLLYSEAVARMPAVGLSTGMWTVPMQHPAMVAFARRSMAPYATRFCETRRVQLALASAALL